MNTNFYGAIRVLKGALPTMRAQKSGTIVQMSSIFGFFACPGGTMYNCSKSAVESLHETLKVELAPFNIRIVILEPGVFRTGILTSAAQPSLGVSQHYLETAVGKVFSLVGAMIQDPEIPTPC
jgi:NAD(P)-dependent dehydrogenase (short-subunit alcohol dehydrogenase family)